MSDTLKQCQHGFVECFEGRRAVGTFKKLYLPAGVLSDDLNIFSVPNAPNVIRTHQLRHRNCPSDGGNLPNDTGCRR
jgi:hypothetical protein